MKQEIIQQFMMQNGECFDPMMQAEIQKQLEEIDDSKSGLILGGSYQKPTLILVIAILLGWDRFFLDDIGMGVVKILTGFGCGVWWLIDIFSAKKRTYEFNYKKFQQALMLAKEASLLCLRPSLGGPDEQWSRCLSSRPCSLVSGFTGDSIRSASPGSPSVCS